MTCCCCPTRYIKTTGFRRSLSRSEKRYSKYEPNKNNTGLTMISTQRRIIFYFHCFPSFISARMHDIESAVTAVSKSTALCVFRKPQFFVRVGDGERLCTRVRGCMCVGVASHCSSASKVANPSAKAADFFDLSELLHLFRNQR